MSGVKFFVMLGEHVRQRTPSNRRAHPLTNLEPPLQARTEWIIQMSDKGYRSSSMFKAFSYCCGWEPTTARWEPAWEHSRWTKRYAMTEDELVAYAAFHDNSEMVRTLKGSGMGNVILDALIRTEMTELFETAAELISYDSDAGMMEDLKITHEDVTLVKEFLNNVNQESEEEEGRAEEEARTRNAQAEEALLEGIGRITTEHKQKKMDQAASELVTWKRVFNMIYLRMEHTEQKATPNATKAEIDKRLEREKSLFAAKTLIYTRLMPIHSACKRKLRQEQTTGEEQTTDEERVAQTRCSLLRKPLLLLSLLLLPLLLLLLLLPTLRARTTLTQYTTHS